MRSHSVLFIFCTCLAFCIGADAATGHRALAAQQDESWPAARVLHEEHYPDGTLKLRRTTSFSDMFETEYRYSRNGTLVSTTEYTDGKLRNVTEELGHGLQRQTSFHPDGVTPHWERTRQAVGEGKFRTTRATGDSFVYRPDGTLKTRALYREGYKVLSEEFSPDGTMTIRRSHYKANDSLIPVHLLMQPGPPPRFCSALDRRVTTAAGDDVFQTITCSGSTRLLVTPFFSLRTEQLPSGGTLTTVLDSDGSALATLEPAQSHSKYVTLYAYDDIQAVLYKKKGIFGTTERSIFFKQRTPWPDTGHAGEGQSLCPYRLVQYYTSAVSMEFDEREELADLMLSRDKRIVHWLRLYGHTVVLDQRYDLRPDQESIITQVSVDGKTAGEVHFMGRPDHLAHPLEDGRVLHVTPKDLWLEEQP